jgi:putative nucleotidyltransferase with HDIG domain
MLLGLDRTRKMVATLATGAYARGALGTVELRRCWEHTMATAILADEVARACGPFTSAAYTAGIIHDIGRLGLLVAYPRQYEAMIRDAAEQCIDLLDFERERFGMHHTEAGRLLIERWGLPDEFLAIAGRHHDPSEGEEVDLLRIVHIACRLADALDYYVSRPLVPLDPETVLAGLPAAARARLRTPPSELREKIQQRLQAFDSANTPSSPEPTQAPSKPAPVEEPVLDSDSDEPYVPVAWYHRWPVILGAAGIAAFIVFLLWR